MTDTDYLDYADMTPDERKTADALAAAMRAYEAAVKANDLREALKQRRLVSRLGRRLDRQILRSQ